MKSAKYVAHSLRSRPLRTVLGLFSIVMTMLLMTATGVVFSTGNSQVRMIFTSGVDYDIEVTKTTSPYNIKYMNVTTVQKSCTPESNIRGFYPIITSLVFPERNSSMAAPVLAFCTPQDYQNGKVSSLEGKYDISGNNIVASKEIAVKYGYSVGNKANITALNATGIPIRDEYVIKGIVEVTGRFPPLANAFIVFNLTHMQDVLGLQGKATSVYLSVDQSLYDMSNIQNPAVKVNEIATSIAERLGPDYHVSTLKAYLLEQSYQATGAFGSLTYVFSIIFPAISGIMIASILNLSVEEKTQELGILRTIGARRSYVARVVLLELGLMLVIAVPIGALLGLILPQYAFRGSLGDVVPALGMAATQVLIALGVIVLFALQPMMKAFNTNPIDAIRKTRKLGALRFVAESGMDRRLVLVGLVIFIIVTYSIMVIPNVLIFSTVAEFIFFVMISIFILLITLCITLLGTVPPLESAIVRVISPIAKKTSKLTQRNLRRYVRRNVSTNIIFGVIVAIMIFTSTVISGVRVSAEDTVKYVNGADIRITSQVPLPGSEYTKFASRDDIMSSSASTDALGVTASKLVEPSGTNVNIYGLTRNFSIATYLSQTDMESGTPTSFEKLDNSSIIISRSIAVELEASVGSKIAIRLGDRAKFLTVTAVMGSFPGYANEVNRAGRNAGRQACFVSIELYAFYAGLKNPESVQYTDVFLRVASGLDHEKVGNDIRNEYSAYQMLFISVTQTFVKQIQDGLNYVEVLLAILTGMLLLVAVFSLVTNLYASVSERSYEIGVLKALGIRRSSLIGSIMTESIVIALASMVIGVISGIVVGFMAMYWISVFSPVGMRFTLPLGAILVLIMVTISASMAGGFFPARSVAKKDVISLMRKIE